MSGKKADRPWTHSDLFGTLEERFWRRVVKGKKNECWLWCGTTSSFGYGSFRYRYKTLLAHRVSFEIAKGPIQRGLLICHKCNNPPCVNPHHLYAGTYTDNNRDAVRAGTSYGLKCKGENSASAILTEKKVLSIRARHAAGEKQNKIARELGVAPQTVNGIIKRRSWRHI